MVDEPNKPDNVEDAEIVNDKQDAPESPAFDIDAYNATLEMVRRRITLINGAKAELKKLKEMYTDVFVNDPGYQEADAVVKEAMKKRKDSQAKLSRQPAVQDAAGKMKDIKEQIKSNEESLSHELMEYYRTAGVTEIEDADGNVQEFDIVIKLKPKKKT